MYTKIGIAAVCGSTTAALSTSLDVESFHPTGSGLYFEKLVQINEYYKNLH